MMEKGRWRKRVLAIALHIVFSVGIVIGVIGLGIGSCFCATCGGLLGFGHWVFC